MMILQLFVMALVICSSTAKDELRLLALVPLTGKEPANGKACVAAMQVVVDEANAQSDFLPGYQVSLTIEDEARNADKAPEALFNFLGSQSGLPNGTYLSPIVLGPSITCQYVTFAARFAHITHFSQFCAGPRLAERDFLPNLYRVQMPGEYSIIAALLFIERIGLWRQISIFTYSLNVNEYMMAKKLGEMATENGIDVIHYSSEADISLEMVQHAKDLGARVVTMIYLQVAMCAKILCYSHMAGMRTPRYVFIGLVYCAFTPDTLVNLPEGCTKEMLTEQLRVTFWVGPSPVAVENHGPTTLGYDIATFERRLHYKLRNTIASDMDQRHLCHDTALAAMVTLNNSDRTLADRYNSSLREFSRNPRLVASVLNESAGSVTYHGLRIGHMQYTSRLEVSNEDIWIMEFEETRIRWLLKVPWFDDGSLESRNQLYNTSRYVFHANQPIRWQTKSDQPPKDLSYGEKTYDEYPLKASLWLSVIASVGAVKTAVIVAALSKNTHRTHLHARTNAVLMTGCILINLAVIFIQIGATYLVSTWYCQVRTVWVTVSVSLVTSIVSWRMLSLVKGIRLNRQSAKIRLTKKLNKRRLRRTLSATSMATNRSRIAPAIPPSRWRQWDQEATVFGLLCSLFSLAVALAWVLTDVKLVVDESSDQFDEIANVYFKHVSVFCGSANVFPWVAALFLPHLIIAIAACYVSCFMAKSWQLMRRPVELNMGKIAVVNTVALFAATFLVLVIVNDANMQTVAFSAVLILYSESISVVWAYPMRKLITFVSPTVALISSVAFSSSRG